MEIIDNKIPIALSSDNNYKLQLLVAVYSILRNKKPTTELSFYILLCDDFDQQIIDSLKIMFLKYDVHDFVFIKMGSKYCDGKIYANHIKTPTFYRLSLPDLLKENKCIYLDNDVVVLKDLADLFNQISAEDDLLSGVKAACFYWPLDSFDDRSKYLKIPKFDRYINCGVTVMNLALMRKLNIVHKFNDLLLCQFLNQDQDILNSACYEHIRVIPPKYNSMTKYWNDDFNNYYSDRFPYLRYCYSESEWKEACEDPVIVHYADKDKPWNTIGVAHLKLWWQYLKEVDEYFPCYEKLYDQFIKDQIIRVRNNIAAMNDAQFELDRIVNSRSYKLVRFIANIAKPFKHN